MEGICAVRALDAEQSSRTCSRPKSTDDLPLNIPCANGDSFHAQAA